jgi:hypothetical protein
MPKDKNGKFLPEMVEIFAPWEDYGVVQMPGIRATFALSVNEENKDLYRLLKIEATVKDGLYGLTFFYEYVGG